MTKNYLRIMVSSLLMLMGMQSTVHAQETEDAVTLAQWTFDSGYTERQGEGENYIYEPNESAFSKIGEYWFKDRTPQILPNVCIGTNTDYILSAKSNARFWQISDNDNNDKVFRIENATANDISDYTDAVTHNVYYEATFPTNGYKDISIDYAICYGGNAAVPIEAVVSTDGGTTWSDAGALNTADNWYTFLDNNVKLSANNKDKVIVRLIAGNGAASNWNLKYLTIKGTKSVSGQTVNTSATATWAFDLGIDGQTATFAPEGTDAYFKNSYEAHGSGLIYKDAREVTGVTETLFQPTNQVESASADNAINFMIVPKNGLKFTPTNISLQSTRFGTDGGVMDIAWINADETTVSLATGVKPNRNKGDEQVSTFTYNVTGATVAEGACGIRVNMYSLGASKQIGFANIIIEGTVEGTVADVKQCKIAVKVNPEDAGTVMVNPVGNEFDVNTELTLSQKRNFSYMFKNWTDDKGNTLSNDDVLTYTLTEDATITANYDKINTYALNYNVEGGGKYYMITLAPEPEVIEGKNMYEDGTTVSLSAASNKIMTFTNWSNGETSGEISLTMDKDQDITANYSATDFIAAWDFIEASGDGRPADFAAADNDADALVMRDAEGNTSGWLDKSLNAAGGYEGRPAAVNWCTSGLGEYYWQTMVNAEAFTDISVTSAMAYNYNAYTQYNVQYSVNGTDWETFGTIKIEGSKSWKDSEFSLPAAANNQKELYIRWIADKTSAIDGTTSDNDGIAISGIYITGTAKLIDDGTAPVLLSRVPTEGSTNASANGKIILTFDEKVKVTDGAKATLGSMELTPTVSGKTVIFEYKGLEYSTEYTFNMHANTIGDLAGNAISKDITLTFSTKTRPVVTKALFDFIVPDDGDFKAAIAAAEKRDDTSKRFRIFVKQGAYTIPASESETITGSDNVSYPSPITRITTPNISIIGEDMDNTSIVNTLPDVEISGDYGPACPIEGLHKNQTLDMGKNATNAYLQDITIKNGMKDSRGRNAAFEDNSNKTICKDVCLHGYQDTYLSNNQNGRFYFEGGRLRGRTDFLCGKGDVFYNGVDLMLCESGGYIAVPSTPKQYGYIFKDCVVKGEQDDIDGKFTLGRPWGSGTPIALFIDTKMEVQPSAIGWNEMSGGWPARFAEYNSTTSTGTVINLSNRKKTFGEDHANDPILTAAEAAQLTIANTMSGDDSWNPTADTEQASAPKDVKFSGNVLTWEPSNYAMCWAVCKNGKVIAFTTEPTYTVDDSGATYSVRAANEMGGLGDATTASVVVGINNVNNTTNVANTKYYNLNGMKINNSFKGTIIKVQTLDNGETITTKIVK